MDDEQPPARRAASRTAQLARALDRSPAMVGALRRLRGWLPGDSSFGDPLSTAGRKHLEIAEQRLTELTYDEPGVVREAGLAALQVWQALLEARGRDQGNVRLTIAFTDLAGFSSWAVKAGDDDALRLLRAVGSAIQPPVTHHGGEVVKWLGDGMMAVFTDAASAYDAVVDGRRRLVDIEVDGYVPRLRAALHTGQPRRVGRDYLGVDVNIAARLAEKASADEILASSTTVELLDPERIRARRKKTFALLGAKGVPDEISVYSLSDRKRD